MKNKINVNISPNPLDLQTLHCSQNDTEERKFYFTLHNNGEVIDTSDISDPIFEPFSVYKGGTEQLLPVNTDDPTTSPIIADIQYPDEEKTEQEFTYRESPTTIDGKALVEKIKGNAIVWNQLISSTTPTTRTPSGTATYDYFQVVGGSSMFANHIYILSADIKYDGSKLPMRVYSQFAPSGGYGSPTQDITNNSTNHIVWLGKRANNSSVNMGISNVATSDKLTSADSYTVSKINLIDLTKMFGSTKADEIYAMEQSESGSGVAYFRSLFPLNYYSYGQKLLPFKGEGIKTVGFNQWDEEWELGSIDTNTGALVPSNVWGRSKNFCQCLPNVAYYLKSSANKYIYWYDASQAFIKSAYGVQGNAYTSPSNAYYFKLANYGWTTYDNDLCFNISSSENGKYESYKSSTTSLPTLTYFPTGMKDVPSAYDELTNSKAITRVGERAYQAGDESDSTVKTDGTTTYYALAEEQVTQFTQASLICEDGESILYQDDDSLVCDCTEDFSKDSGFKDCKIKFTNDGGVVYSNKIQLHIERKP